MAALERITIDVPREIASSLRQGVIDGGYENEGQIVTEAVRDWECLPKSDELKLAALRRSIDQSDASGPGIPADEVYAELQEIISSYQRGR